ncbi:MAG: putative ATP-dependent DNA helicase [Streblomastix strix]|uniref:Putative ATP-dependent DNA helicase n=1 Tax=Streblomastix strix TaxID=222440 RepID=A0A5J4TWX7_9EUKA|nr:MAG: putative ATP-dependent DNA helicase [Streblomastix strix]
MIQDTMAINRKRGKVILFTIVPANPKLPLITDNLFKDQTAQGRPDLCCIIFKMKSKELIKDITQKRFFGKHNYSVGANEFQKRGLPHIHLLTRLGEDINLKSASMIDKLIQCELPDPAKEKEYYDLIVTHQIRGPCLHGDPRCWKHEKCSKGFPKKYLQQTVFNADGYRSY